MEDVKYVSSKGHRRVKYTQIIGLLDDLIFTVKMIDENKNNRVLRRPLLVLLNELQNYFNNFELAMAYEMAHRNEDSTILGAADIFSKISIIKERLLRKIRLIENLYPKSASELVQVITKIIDIGEQVIHLNNEGNIEQIKIDFNDFQLLENKLSQQ